jgi:hypothetical protein
VHEKDVYKEVSPETLYYKTTRGEGMRGSCLLLMKLYHISQTLKRAAQASRLVYPVNISEAGNKISCTLSSILY